GASSPSLGLAMSRDTKTNIRFFSPSINHLCSSIAIVGGRACWAYSVITVGLAILSHCSTACRASVSRPRPCESRARALAKILAHKRANASLVSVGFNEQVSQSGSRQSKAFRPGSFVPFTILCAWSTGQPIQLNGSRVLTKRINQRQACHDEVGSQ